MAQHDFVINNQGFPAFRSDLNDFLNAVRTTHSGTSLPSGAVAGTIWLDTTSATIPLLKYYDGTDNILLATINHSTNTVTFSGVATDLVNDLTPQLGGDLDVQTNKVVSTSNLNVKVYPNGTGVFEVGGSTNSGRIQLNCEQNTHGIKLASPPHSAGQNYTLTFPSTAPSAGKVLQTDGSGNLSFESVSGGISWQSSVKTSGFTATAGEGYFCNTTSSAFTVTLPATPTAGQQVAVVDYAGTFDTNSLVISPNGNKIEGGTGTLQLSDEREGVLLVYIDSTQGWLATSGINEGTDALAPVPYSIDFLVIAGGGSGGSNTSSNGGAGGGGAGGYRTSTQTVTAGTVITVTVGDGGASRSADAGTNGASGSDSSISGSGLTTITSAGGGGGGKGSSGGTNNGVSGGSGGGGGSNAVGSGGSGNTPSTSPSQGSTGGTGFDGSDYNGGGGGGASAVGDNATASGGGNGGAGTASSITGSSITRGGGGGGGVGYVTEAVGLGGTGGGGAGALGNAVNGTANTGGGGGGTGGSRGTSGAGGKGVVILAMPLASFSGTVTGSPTESDDGTTKRLVFNGSGSYTT